MFVEPFSTAIVATAPVWLPTVRDMLWSKGKEVAIEKGKDLAVKKGTGFVRDLLHLDEKEQLRHLELALKNAVERGIARFDAPEERDQYREVLKILFEPGSHSDALRREALRLLTLSDTPDLAELNKAYNQSLRTRALSEPTPPAEVDAAPYLSSFFEALIAELYADSFFRQQMSDVLRVRAARSLQQSQKETVAELKHISRAVVHDYTEEQFERDLQAYVAHIERTFHRLRLVSVVPKDLDSENPDPELDSIFVPLRISLQDTKTQKEEEQNSVVTLLEKTSYVVLLGGPGSGKSTLMHHLAWSHAQVNLPNSSSALLNTPLLSGNPIPLYIELRLFIRERRKHPYNFLSYMIEVLLRREGIDVDIRMFKKLLERRNMLLLFDGLDEVATLDERRILVEEIERFGQSYPGNRILVTSRPVGYKLMRFSDQWFVQAEVKEFNDEQIRQFLERWYMHVLRSPILYPDRQELEELFTTLKENRRLRKLAENPLLLTVITALHRRERLPDRRVQVYDRCADLLLEKWARIKGTHVRWESMKMISEDQRECVAHLGFVLHKRSQEKESDSTKQEDASSIEEIASDVSTRFMRQEIERFLKSRMEIAEATERRAEAKRFLDLMQFETGLILERGTDETGESLYGFVHRTFQEYFAAADVYERYQQKEDPRIISKFLKENLHDPHWREVILLLLGKLKRTPITSQLRQVLDGKIKSCRSLYTNILQQDLFFVCDCLIEEINIERELAKRVVLRLSHVVKTSPFPSQRRKALDYLGKLMQTRQYTDLGRKALTDLVIQDSIPDISTRIEVARILHESSSHELEEQRQATQRLLELLQRPNLSIKEIVQVARALYGNSPYGSLDQRQAGQRLLELLQRPSLSIEEIVQVAQALYTCSSYGSEEKRLAGQRLLELLQRPSLSIEEIVQVAQVLYTCSSYRSEEKQQAIEKLSELVQNSDLLIDQVAQVTHTLYRYIFFELENERQPPEKLLQVIQQALQLIQNPDLSIERIVELAYTIYHNNPDGSLEQQQVTQRLLQLVQNTDLSIKQTIRVARVLYICSPYGSEEERQAMQRLLQLIPNSELPIEQTIEVGEALYQLYESEERQATQRLLELLRHPSLSIEEIVQVAQALYTCSPYGSEEKRLATQRLLQLTNTNLSLKQTVQVAQALCTCTPYGSLEQRQAIQKLLQLIQNSELPIKQTIEVARTLYQNSSYWSRSYEQQQAIQSLLQLVQNPNISVEQIVELVQTLNSCSANSEERHLATQRLLQVLQNPNLSVEQIVAIVKAIYTYGSTRLEDDRLVAQRLLQLAQQSLFSVEQVLRLYQYLFEWSKEQRSVAQSLLQMIQNPNLSVDQAEQVEQTLHEYRPYRPQKWRQAIQRLWDLAQRVDLSIEQMIQVALALYVFSSRKSENRQQAIQRLLNLAQRADLSIEQMIQVALALSLFGDAKSEGQRQETRRLLESAHQPNLSLEQTIQITQALYMCSLSRSEKQQQASQILWQLAQKQELTLEERLRIATVPLTVKEANYPDRVQSVEMVFALLPEGAAKHYLAEQWRAIDTRSSKAEVVDIPYIVKLVRQEMLPEKIRDEVYMMLYDMVPQFDKIPLPNDQPTP
jgi:uncharacterized protein YerC/energy-coupling factor transporter ATP-binding protein EcfA2